MPRIINAYDGNSALGDTLSKLGEAIYGDQSKNEVYRQTAFGKKRENDNMEPFAAALRDNNSKEALYRGVLSGSTGQNFGDYNRARAAVHSGGNVDSPDLATSFMGAGGSFSGTAPGQGRELANRSSIAAGNNATTLAAQRLQNENNIATTGMNNTTSVRVGEGNNNASRDVAHISADKTAQSDKYKFDNTYEQTYDPATGRTVLTPRSQAAGREVAPTKDSVVGSMLRQVAEAQRQPQVPGQTAGPVANPFAALPPQIQHVAGVAVPEQSLIEPRSGQTGISRDGGQTIILPDGRTVPNTGFQPVGQETALTQARDNNVRATAATPLAVSDPTKSQAAADASQASGLGAKVQKLANEEIGAIPGGSSILKAVTGSPEIAPGTQRAQSQLDIRNNAARSVLLGAPGRQTVQAQQWVNELLPQGAAFANPATEANKIPTIVNALKADYTQIQQAATDPNTLPAERVKMVQQLRQIENSIRLFTESTAGAPAQPTPAAAPTQQAAAAPAAGAQGAPSSPISDSQQPNIPTVSTPQEAMALPPGTQFRTPDGRVKIR